MYPDFVETVVRIVPLYWARAFGGSLFLAGFCLMLYNVYRTIQLAPKPGKPAVQKAFPLWMQLLATEAKAHRKLEGMATIFTVLVLVGVVVGSVIEIYPTLSLHKYLPEKIGIRPYSPLELAGRDLYIREGCYLCHSQQIRTLSSEVLRYGAPSTVEESMYDHPFQWGSKRTGPDLARVGKKYPDLWHFQHMIDPRSINQQSIMPNYRWLAEKNLDFLILRKEVSILRNLGTPYSDDEVANADQLAEKQAFEISEGIIAQGGPKGLQNKEIMAMIAYLQALGQMKKSETTGEVK